MKHFDKDLAGNLDNQAMDSNEIVIKKKSEGLKTGYNLCIFTTLMIVLLSIIVIINDATRGVPIDMSTQDNQPPEPIPEPEPTPVDPEEPTEPVDPQPEDGDTTGEGEQTDPVEPTPEEPEPAEPETPEEPAEEPTEVVDEPENPEEPAEEPSPDDELRAAFDQLDLGGDGILDADDLAASGESDLVDENGDGIDFEEYKTIIAARTVE